jgi:hypothetical protein
MGRNSLDATNAFLMRAVCAALAALLARLTGFLPLAPAFFALAVGAAESSALALGAFFKLSFAGFFAAPSGLAAALALATGLAVFFAPVSGLAALLELASGLTAFLAFFALEDAELAVRCAGFSEVCAASGVTTIKAERKPAAQSVSTGAETEEITTLISPL